VAGRLKPKPDGMMEWLTEQQSPDGTTENNRAFGFQESSALWFGFYDS